MPILKVLLSAFIVFITMELFIRALTMAALEGSALPRLLIVGLAVVLGIHGAKLFFLLTPSREH